MVLERPGHFVRETFDIPQTGADEFLLRVELVTICGGDLIEYQGGNRKAKYPLLMGHELVGTVEAVGDRAAEAHGIDAGDRIMVEPYIRCGRCPACVAGDYHFCREGLTYGVTIPSTREPHLWGAYSQYMYGAPGARVHRINPDVPAAAGALTTVVANGVRWVRKRANLRMGEGVIITGLGVQALSSIIVARLAGAGPIVVVCRETNPERLALAREYGADIIYNTEELRADPSLRQELQTHRLQVGIECTGAEEPYRIAVEALQPMGRLVAVGTRGGRPLSVDLDGIVFKELDILGGLGQAGDTELAADIVNSGEFAVEKMVSHVLPLARADEAIQMCMEGREDVIHVGLDPWAD
ncbi:zinc-binding dehydrogenase [Nonomuraea sp. NPDC048916]|uniref:zinc-dependent alcohol dehydrogenase n=1 Tax=Nonomuraea sp. NPDC048916 TaxID=3154232 RepID=UPI0033D37124